MNILIVGASGLIGGNCYHFLKASHQVYGTHLSFDTSYTFKFDPVLPDDIKLLNKLHLDVIIHTGALTHVDRCEAEPELSYKLTVQSTINLVDYAKINDITFLYTSTDYVFDGLDGPYKETDHVNPLSIYGKHKLLAEEYIQKNLSKYFIVRITNVYGDELRNKNFVSRIVETLKSGNVVELEAPFDQFATPVNALDVARVFDIAISNNLRGIYHLGSTDFVSRVQLLNIIKRYFPAILHVKGVSTEELKQTANRPLIGGLISYKFIKEFPNFEFSNLDKYLSSITK